MAYTWPYPDLPTVEKYVDADYAEGSSDGSITDPYTTIQAGYNAMSAANGTMAIADGTYTEYLDMFTKADSIIYLGGDVTLTGSATDSYAWHTSESQTIKEGRLIFTATKDSRDCFYANGADSIEIDSLRIEECGEGVLVDNSASPTTVIIHKFEAGRHNTTDVDPRIIFAGSNVLTATIESSFIDDPDCQYQIQCTNTNASSVININNTIHAGCERAIIYRHAVFVGTVNHRNSIAAGHGWDTNNEVYKADGTNTLNQINCNILPHPFNDVNLTDEQVTDGGNNTTVSPLFAAARRPCYVSLCIDDSINLPSFTSLADQCTTAGLKATLALDLPDQQNAAFWTTLRGHLGDGHGVSIHTMNATNFGDFSAFDIQETVGATTMTIDVDADTLVTTGANPLAYTLSDYASITALVAALNGETGYTVTVNAAQYAGNGLTSSLADVTTQDINGSSYTALYDTDRSVISEVTACRDYVENELGANTCRSLIYPGGHSSDAAAIAFGNLSWMKGARATTSEGVKDPEYHEIFRHYSYRTTDVLPTADWTPTNTARLISLLEWGKMQGAHICIYAHSTAEYSAADWLKIINIIAADDQLTPVTLQEGYEAMRLAGTMNLNGQSSTPRLDTDFSVADTAWVPSLKSTSTLIDAGVRWWSGPNPIGLDGEPFADFDTSIGSIQSKDTPFHPTNL